jgi:acid phosphatase
MHNCSVTTGDKWLSQNIPNIVNSPAISKSNYLLIITWDEADAMEGNHIVTLLYGPQVKKGYTSNYNYNHYSTLATIEKSWGLPALTINDAAAQPMSDFFKN